MKRNSATSIAQPKERPKQATLGGAQAIRRAIEVVRVVAQIQLTGASLSRVVRATGLTTSTAFRILRSLADERLLRYDTIERNYYVGPLAFELGLAASTGSQVHAQWRDTVEEVARETRLTTYLMGRSDNDVVCLLCAQGYTALRAVPMDVGQRLPLGVGAGSLAILAALGDDEIERILSAQESRLELFPGGRASPARILERVALTREHGFAFSDGVVATGAIGIGVAILPPEGVPQLAISVSAVAGTVNLANLKGIASMIHAAIERRVNRP